MKCIIQSKNDYLIRVKANQPKLYNQVIENTTCNEDSVDSCIQSQVTRGRKELRKVYVFNNLQGISPEWVGIKRLIKADRTRVNHGHVHHVIGYYISSYEINDAKEYYEYVQNMWGIENRLHWVKDVIMKEDDSKTAQGMAAQNISILRDIAINIYRSHGFDSIKYATQKFDNNVSGLIKLIG